MSIKGLILKQNEVAQEFDLNQILGQDVSGDDSLQEAVGQYIIDKIVERAQGGRAATGSALKGYSESYKNSLAFHAYGKTESVDMTLTGDMLNSLAITRRNGGKVKIGWADATNNAKAYGHMTGMKGHPTLEGKTPVRQFFGLNDKDIADLRREFRRSSRRVDEANDEAVLKRLIKLVGA